jgi:hypothetical protein
MGPLPKFEGCEYILVAVDYVSKWVKALPCRVTDALHSKKMFHVDGPEKMTRGGVNGSQSKFLAGTQHISQTEPDAPLFKLGQDRIAIDKLSVLRIGLGTAIETRNSASKIMSEIDDKN